MTKEELHEYDRKYYEKNKKKIEEQQKKYRQDNKEKIASTTKVYREANKEKKAVYMKEYQKANKEKIKTWRKVYNEVNKEKKLRLLDWLIERYGDIPCMDCDRVFPWECMDFDHRPGETKSFNISQSGTNRASPTLLAETEKEIAKCDLICSNCHRTRTKERNRSNSHGRNPS